MRSVPRAAPTSSSEGPEGWTISAAGCQPDARPSSHTTASWRAEMRVMFVVYLVLITAGITFCSVIGLMHN